jgi:hypothetical protein
MPLAVDHQSPEVIEMSQEWPIVDALLGGTRKMREAGESLLPRWPNEEPAAYRARLNTATLFPAFRRTLGVMGGKPFAKQVTLGEDVPEQIREWADDIDLQGRNLHAFCADLLSEAIAYGVAGVLVDSPPVRRDEGRALTQDEERALGVRPYFVHIKHDQILGWKAGRVGGVMRLMQLRLSETFEEPDGRFGTVNGTQVRVLEPGRWELHRKDDNGEFVLFDEGTTTLGEIPFVPFYGRRLGFMRGVSPLIDLAYLNVKHWQSQSDQDTILHVARVPILAMIGAEDGTALTVGASSAVKLPPGADLKFVEHSGAAITAGKESLEALEEQMIQTGAELLVAKPGQRSATEANNDAEANKSELQSIVENFEDSIDMALYLMGAWVGIKEYGHVSLFKDFSAGSLSDASAQLILAFQQGGLITKRQALIEGQRIGVLSPDLDPEAELEAVEAEGPSLGLIGRPEDDGDIA